LQDKQGCCIFIKAAKLRHGYQSDQAATQKLKRPSRNTYIKKGEASQFEPHL
jgi:hypothetical protein